jgi:hypothetical protein
MNFHIISAYNSEISSELSEYSELAGNFFRNCPNDLGKKFGIVRILRIDLGKKFGFVRILRMTSEIFLELSELTSEKIQNSELRSETTTLIRKIFQASSEKISALALPLLVQFLNFIRKKISNFIRKKIPNYIWKKSPNYIC